MGKSKAKLKTLLFWTIILVPLLFALEATSYVLRTNLVPARIRARVGCGSAEFQLAERHRAQFLRPHVVKSAATAKGLSSSKEPDLRMFNSVLGWDYPPDVVYRDYDGILYRHGSSGERLTCTSVPNDSHCHVRRFFHLL